MGRKLCAGRHYRSCIPTHVILKWLNQSNSVVYPSTRSTSLSPNLLLPSPQISLLSLLMPIWGIYSCITNYRKNQITMRWLIISYVVSLTQESGHALAGTLLQRPSQTVVTVSVRAVVSCEGSTGKRSTSNFIWFWQNPVPCGFWTEGLCSLLTIDWRQPSVSCHVGLCMWKSALSKSTKEKICRNSL